MVAPTTLEDLIGIEHCKLGFYQELQRKVEELKHSNHELEKKRQEFKGLLDAITDLMVVLSEDLHRITSYNVCYTKLLRPFLSRDDLWNTFAERFRRDRWQGAIGLKVGCRETQSQAAVFRQLFKNDIVV